MRILSWDCGFRTLAYCDISINISALHDTAEMLRQMQPTPAFAQSVLDKYATVIHVHSAGVVDFVGENMANLEEHQKAARLYKFLESHKVAENTDCVLIERQPMHLSKWGGASSASTSVAQWLLFYYAQRLPTYFISPKEKNKISMFPGGQFVVAGGTESQKKTARKLHATRNFTWILANFPHGEINISPPMMNHAADACMQAVAFAAKKINMRP